MTYLPPLVEQGRLVKELASLVASRGHDPLVSAPLLEPRPEHFPDVWRADALGVERLARRLLIYAGLPDLGVDVDLFDGAQSVTRAAAGPSASAWSHQGTAAWFAGIEGGRCHFGADVHKLATPDLLVGIMAHEVAHAFRRVHRLEVSSRDEEERLTDLTTVYLGFGVLTTNASYRYRAQGDLRHTAWSHQTVGYLPSQAMSFLLAAQVVVRGLPAAERRRVAGLLEANQAAYFKAACEELDRPTLIERLKLPPPRAWPELVSPAPEAFDTKNDPPPPDPERVETAALRARFEGMPVFRIGRTAAVRYAVLATPLGIGAALALGSVAPWWAGFAVFLGVILGGRVLGRRRRHDRCSEPECAWVIPPEAERCPGCGGTVSGRIAQEKDRLAAREGLEDGDDR